MGNILGQRDALELGDEALQIKNSKESCNLLPTGIPLCHQIPFKTLKKDQTDDKYTWNQRHKLQFDTTTGNACAMGKHL